jgi:transposase
VKITFFHCCVGSETDNYFQQKGKEVYKDMEQWLQIRQRALREGVSKRQILKETGMHWTTLEKILNNSSPPGYQRTKPPKKTKIGPYLNRIREILEQDKTIPKKQRHTAHRIWQRLKTEGFTGGYTIVKDAVREIKKTSKEVFMPLKHPPGEAQVDFGQAVVLNMCREDMQRKVRGQTKIKEKLLSEEQFSLRPLPLKPFDACV